MPLLLEENRDKICLVISPLNELEADHVWQRLSLEMVDLTIALLRVGSIFFFTEKPKIPAVAVNRDTRAKSATSPPIALAAVTDVDEPPTVAGTRLGLSTVG